MSETAPVEPAPAAEHKNIGEKTMDFAKGAVSKTGEVLHKAVDATILDKSPHGTVVDGTPRLDGGLAKDVFDHTVGDVSPHGTNVDHAVNINVGKH